MRLFTLLVLTLTFVHPLANAAQSKQHAAKKDATLAPIYRLDSTDGSDDHQYSADPAGLGSGYTLNSESFDLDISPEDANAIALYSCFNSTQVHHYISTDATCNGDAQIEVLGYMESQGNATDISANLLYSCINPQGMGELFTLNAADCTSSNYIFTHGFTSDDAIGYVAAPANGIIAATVTSGSSASTPATPVVAPTPAPFNASVGDFGVTDEGINYQFYTDSDPSVSYDWNDVMVSSDDGSGAPAQVTNLGGQIKVGTQPLAINYNGDVYVFATSIDGDIEFMTLFQTQGAGWQNLGGSEITPLTLSSVWSDASGTLWMQAQDINGSTYQRSFDQNWFLITDTVAYPIQDSFIYDYGCPYGTHWDRFMQTCVGNEEFVFFVRDRYPPRRFGNGFGPGDIRAPGFYARDRGFPPRPPQFHPRPSNPPPRVGPGRPGRGVTVPPSKPRPPQGQNGHPGNNQGHPGNPGNNGHTPVTPVNHPPVVTTPVITPTNGNKPSQGNPGNNGHTPVTPVNHPPVVNKPVETPVSNPTPVFHPPMTVPSTPVETPSTPVSHPSEPVSHPSEPVSHPSEPVSHPSSPPRESSPPPRASSPAPSAPHNNPPASHPSGGHRKSADNN